MAIQTFIAFDVDGSHIPILAADDIIRQVKFQISASFHDYGNDGFIRARHLGRIDEIVVDPGVVLMAYHALHGYGVVGLVELLGLIDPRHNSKQASGFGFAAGQGSRALVLSKNAVAPDSLLCPII